MQLRTIEPEEPLDDVDDELRETQLHTGASPLTAALAPPFAAHRQELIAVRAEEVQLDDGLKSAEVLALFADDDLNALADETKVAVLAEVKNDYQSPLYRRLFAGQSPSELKRPVLGEQLATMRAWIAPLCASANPTLSSIGERLEQVVARADEAVSAQALAQQRMDQFRAGPRKEFIDRCNALRKLTLGKLAEIAHTHPELRLPSTWPERFFLHDSSSRARTIPEVKRSIERLQKQLARQEAILAELEAKQVRAERARQEAQLEERRHKLAAAEKKAAEAAAELAALQVEIGRAAPTADAG